MFIWLFIWWYFYRNKFIYQFKYLKKCTHIYIFDWCPASAVAFRGPEHVPTVLGCHEGEAELSIAMMHSTEKTKSTGWLSTQTTLHHHGNLRGPPPRNKALGMSPWIAMTKENGWASGSTQIFQPFFWQMFETPMTVHSYHCAVGRPSCWICPNPWRCPQRSTGCGTGSCMGFLEVIKGPKCRQLWDVALAWVPWSLEM